ncbi:unnamed protein product [Rotaria sp. Silwood2]|nr:unnamed protein product [Rotaria sp. Silwood2]CAF2696414.1 unnamed protein product [Rotaria sp. Silwood2]CAF2987348.1 unnamed protein product [Rotaria sp. Silwood2]CAF3131151.1 unnamed protein product [Rotaria sp. Silwood2]CAF4062674.1 unnamed protein product [Rotaria sp. Silwood2]
MNKSEQKKRHRQDSSLSSDDDQIDSTKIDVDGYDDKYFGDAADRVWLQTLSEREREAELLKRHEQREILKHREEISKKLKSKITNHDDNDNDNETKTKSTLFDNNIYADDDDDDDYYLSANSRKQVNASKLKETQHSKSLQALIEERKKKQDEKIKKSLPKLDDLSSSDDETKQKSVRPKQTEKLQVDQVYSSSSSDEEDDHRERSRSPKDKKKDFQKQESKNKKLTRITTKAELKPMILSRFRMEKWCHAPFFANVVKGAFVRINIGQNNGKPVYRLCEIRDVVETGKIYNLGPTRTNKGLRLKHGHNERVFRLEFVSNSETSDAEFKRWRETSLKQNIPLPTLEQVEDKRKAINKFKHYVYSNREITKIVEEKKRFRKAPINYAMTKQELFKEIEIAVDENDTKTEKELRKKLNEMEERASEIDRIRTANNSILAQINRRNRKKTQQNVENALTREAQEHRNIQADPFTRRRCAPILVSKAATTKDELIRELHLREAEKEKAKKKLEEERLLEEQMAKKAALTANQMSLNRQISREINLPAMTINERGSFTSFTDNNDELFASHNFELDIHIKIFPE